MFEIINCEFVGPDVKQFEILAPRIASKWRAGQFIILRVNETGERIPLTVAETSLEKGTITLFVQGIGKTTKLLNSLQKGDFISDVVGPLGEASLIENFGTVATIGGGVGTAIAYPITKALKQAGNHVHAILGARTKSLLILEEQLKSCCDELHVCTDDGSYGFHGFVTQKLEELISQQKIDLIYAIGPIPMMKAVANLTKKYGIKTIVSLNPIMVDGTGMCGGCRVTVDGKTRFACVDGPEFDAHLVDFNELMQRNSSYKAEEATSLEQFKAHTCHLSQIVETKD